MPKYFIKNRTITKSKKGNINNYSNYRTIAILSRSSKVILSIIKIILKKRVEERQDIYQFYFRTSKGTGEAILTLRQLLERRVDMNGTTLIAFLDLGKAFD